MVGNIDKVEIKEPPIQELQKKRSCLWRSCATGGGCILLFLIGSAVIIKFATTPSVKKLKAAPDHVAGAVPLYDADNADAVKFTAGADRQKSLARAAAIPRLILLPILNAFGGRLELASSTADHSFNLQLVKNLLQPVAADERDVVQIEWRDLPATPEFIENWYETEFKKKQFALTANGADSERQLTFRKKDIDGTVSLQDDPATPGTESVLITIYVPAVN